jgi:predicted secreted protein
MSITLGIAIYIIIWWTVLFAVLPFGVRTQGDVGEVVPGTPESAPVAPRLARVMIATTVVAAVVFLPVMWAMNNRAAFCGLLETLFRYQVCA